jgi:enamine deaminase RidA (YjgF/YER057c/UK114 family)
MSPSLTDDAIEIVQDGRPVGFFTSSTLPLATKSKVGGGGAPFSDDFMMSGAMALDWAKKSRPDGTETLADETRYVLDSLERTYALMGGTLRDIVRMTVFVQDIEYGSEIVATIAERYAGGPAPKVLLIEASVAYDCRLELETLALRPSENPGPAAVGSRHAGRVGERKRQRCRPAELRVRIGDVGTAGRGNAVDPGPRRGCALRAGPYRRHSGRRAALPARCSQGAALDQRGGAAIPFHRRLHAPNVAGALPRTRTGRGHASGRLRRQRRIDRSNRHPLTRRTD